MTQLSAAYTAEVDTVDERTWYQFLRQFDDANIYQAWAWGKLAGCGRNMSHLILRKNGEVVAMAQSRITKVPLMNAGDAYLQWGPLWRRRGTEEDPEILRQAIRALRNEYTCKRGLLLRLLPKLHEEGAPRISGILREEGLSFSVREPRRRTILMSLDPSLKALRAGMSRHSKRHLKAAEGNGLEVVEGDGDELFQSFLSIYDEMVQRKGFVPGSDPRQYRLLQSHLPEDMKLKVFLCRSREDICAGLIGSAIGGTGIYLFGATANGSRKSSGSYLLHWKFIEELKRGGVSIYDLHGIDPEKNPGTYRFKQGLAGENGREASFLGRFDSHAGSLSDSCVKFGEWIRSTNRSLREFIRSSRSTASSFKTAHL